MKCLSKVLIYKKPALVQVMVGLPQATNHYLNPLRPVTHICIGNLTIIGSDNGLSPGRRQAIIWTNAGILLIGPLGTNFSEILIKIIPFAFKKMRSNVSSGKCRPSCLGLNVLTNTDKVSWCHIAPPSQNKSKGHQQVRIWLIEVRTSFFPCKNPYNPRPANSGSVLWHYYKIIVTESVRICQSDSFQFKTYSHDKTANVTSTFQC